MEQCVAPRVTQIKMYELFREKYGLNVKREIENCCRLRDREMAEWSLSDIVIAPSSYVQKELISAGAEESKIKLAPYGFTVEQKNIQQIIDKRFEKKSSVFKVLFVGNGMLRKGIQDIAEIALKLNGENIEFRIAGKLNMTIIEKFRINKIENIKLLGKLDKATLFEEYKNADLFILPSYLEGSAMVTIEALNFGLPAIVTEQSGSSITSGVDGYVCEAGDIKFMVSHILKLKHDDDLRYKISQYTIPLLEKTNFETYRTNLINILR
jgi:glycosyltransferase involved in cell wall biosynthesis